MDLPSERRSSHNSMDAPDSTIPAGARPGAMKKRSVVIAGHRTSVSLENVFWSALKEIAIRRSQTVNQLVTDIDRNRNGNLSSSIRVFVLLANRREEAGTDTTESRLAAGPLQ